MPNRGAPRGHLYLLVFDQRHIATGNEQIARRAAETFIKNRVRPSDRVAVIGLGTSVVDVGAVSPLFQTFPFLASGRDGYDVTGDGQRFLVSYQGGEAVSSPVTLVVNWVGDVKKK